MQCTANWATIENFSAVVAGMNGGKDAKVNGRLPRFATYEEIEGEILYADSEVDLLLALTACQSCGEVPDRFDRCGCDYC